MITEQAGILAPLPPHARYMSFDLADIHAARHSLAALQALVDGTDTVVGIGLSLAEALDAQIPGLRTFPANAGPGFEIPSTPAALWCWLRGEERGPLFHRARELETALADAFSLNHEVDAFVHDGGRDLSGYEDGTENPKGEEARKVALVSADNAALAGSSFVAVQLWEHDFDRLRTIPRSEQDAIIGRRRSDNEELKDAPASAHVKRTAQESFAPEAFMWRRSMPWVEGEHGGFMFVAFGHTLDAFEVALNRMVGKEDGIPDALFRFTRPMTGAYFWCPAMKDGQLELSPLGV
ncbi:MAG: peroxidase [Chromatiales bacterium 21-64-14]|nr:MAG: peroxidase [Chromatiales bacterium 21-64-14]HQU17292.1 Dyp-type peroxidase [Gammaproteobacteria bacterium]